MWNVIISDPEASFPVEKLRHLDHVGYPHRSFSWAQFKNMMYVNSTASGTHSVACPEQHPSCPWHKELPGPSLQSPVSHQAGPRTRWCILRASLALTWGHQDCARGTSSRQIVWISNLQSLTAVCRSCLHDPYGQLPPLLPLHAKHCCYMPANFCLHCNLSGTGRLSLLCFGRHPTYFQAFNKQSRNDSDGGAET